MGCGDTMKLQLLYWETHKETADINGFLTNTTSEIWAVDRRGKHRVQAVDTMKTKIYFE